MGVGVAGMSVERAAAAVGVSRDTILRAIHADQLAATGKGGRRDPYRITRRDLNTYATARRTVQRIAPDGQEPTSVDANTLPRYFTLREVAEQSGLPLRWLKEQCRTGGIEHYRLSERRIRMDAAQIAAAGRRFQGGADREVERELAARASQLRRRAA